MRNAFIISEQGIAKKIHLIRGKNVMLDSDLASMYGVETKRLKEQVKRNMERFPEDFMFELGESEFADLRSQIASSKKGRGGTRYPPLVFTEHGVLMLSSVLHSKQAIAVNIQIMRVFAKFRQILGAHHEILVRLEKLEETVLQCDKRTKQQEEEVQMVFSILKKLVEQSSEKPRKKIGFRQKNQKAD